MFDVPDGFSLNLSGRGDQWTARLIPDGHTASKWSAPAIQAKAQTAEDAVNQCLTKLSLAS